VDAAREAAGDAEAMNENRVRELLAERDVIEHGDGIYVDPVLFDLASPVTMLELKQLLETWLDSHCISVRDDPREDADVDQDAR
jgi:hypothetical protein